MNVLNSGKGTRIDRLGYVRITRRSSPHHDKHVHRVVMEEALGRKLKSYETVHHINGDRTDNSLENLEIWHKRKHVPGQRALDADIWSGSVPSYQRDALCQNN